jgi:DNA-binding response OmpR family regulator
MNEKPKILLIEDDIDLVESIKKLLETKGYDARIAYDPEEGTLKLNQDKPDLIILDVMFGSKGKTKGFDFARKIKNDRLFADIPIVMMSAINTKESFFNFSPEIDGEYLPVDCFLDKPVQPDELFLKVENLLKRKTNK